MKKIALIMLFLAMPALSENFGTDRSFSLGLHGAEAIVGNYGLTLAYRVASHLEMTLPLEFYSFDHSLPGLLVAKVVDRFASNKGIKKIPELSMFHARAGIGARLFFSPAALSSGLYVEPILYGGWLRHSDFGQIEFDDKREALEALIKTVYRKLPTRNHFALSPQLNLGYQWISQSGFLFQLALYGNYVYAPDADTIFSASDRFFSSDAVKSSYKARWSQEAIGAFRFVATQVNGWHAGAMINFGMAI